MRDDGKLGIVDCTMILIGGMIGSAIFSLSGVTIQMAGPAAILSWVIAAVILLSYGLQSAELASLYPESGGIFVFPAKTLGKNASQGRLWGWVAAWAYLFGCVSGAAFSAMYVGTYLGVAFPALANAQVPLGIAAVLICGLLNMMNFTLTGKANTVLTVTLAATLLLFTIISFASGQWSAGNLVPFFTQGTKGPTGFISAIPIASVAYSSIVAAAFMVGEIRDANRTIPRAMLLAMAAVVALYVLVIIAVLGLVSTGYLVDNPDMSYIPLYAAAYTKLSSIPWLVALISISAVIALFTTIIVIMALAARTIQACAASGILPTGLARGNARTQAPVNALVVAILVTGVLAAFPSISERIIDFGALCNVITFVVICVTVMKARKLHPDAQGFKAPGGKAMPVVTLILLAACYVPDILNGGWELWACTGAVYAVGMAIYYLPTAVGSLAARRRSRRLR